jgi:uncharacterized protein YuzB (UPF0349 family)
LYWIATCCRDIKPENLLMLKTDREPVLKVIDYGCSTFCVPGKRLCKKFGTVSIQRRD